MGYDLRAVIGGAELVRGVVRDLGAGAAPDPACGLARGLTDGPAYGLAYGLAHELGQGLALLPMTDELFDAVTNGDTGCAWGFFFLPGGFGARLARWSAAGAGGAAAGPLAYVEADFFGGVGEQHAAVWQGGDLALGPLHMGVDEPFDADGSPISQALRHLGAVAGDAYDEFAAVGLRRHRRTGDWAEAAAQAAGATGAAGGAGGVNFGSPASGG
ncbi:hypothetical protein [Actinacidiphila epipremni]|uniref:Uncharacterized protein n=1 Tax=Actinacidiphila epipremni TaxID=2053013 RepID=A0ABX0ZL41_9ACTN|nr:hypothetical protein [Actinacidiphila epipremni]NJP44570.1 hypothetical protein [Actinacidiphila epipremni]